MTSQTGILAPVPRAGRYLQLRCTGSAEAALRALSTLDCDPNIVVGIGPGLARLLTLEVPGLRPFPALDGVPMAIPTTPVDLWLWVRGDDSGQVLHRGRQATRELESAFVLDHVVDAFKHRDGRDLSGYVDGTENPEGEDASRAALLADGSSFCSVQQWVHDWATLDAMSRGQQDHAIGRRLSDNEELDDAPPSAHVKRTAQEDFEPEAFVVRRSMPWSTPAANGLMFTAFGATLDAFEAQLRRMCGLDDGIIDGLFQFTRPVSGFYVWCPPVVDGRLVMAPA
ncbi:MAG: putative iron-dependent peroxidase [Myxococcota bacterium]|jgi:putative iron-dependent peroxidase